MGALDVLTEGNEFRKAQEKSTFIIFRLIHVTLTLGKNEKRQLLVLLVKPAFLL